MHKLILIKRRFARWLSPELASLADKAELAYVDHHTGAGNARAFDVRLQELIDKNEPFAAIVIDINKFKQVNSQVGHVVADDLLQQFVAELTKNVRLDDGVFVGSSLFRTGGDEFVVLLPLDTRNGSNLTYQQRLDALLSRLKKDFLDGHTFTCTNGKAIVISAAAEGAVLLPEEFTQNDTSNPLNNLFVRVLESKR